MSGKRKEHLPFDSWLWEPFPDDAVQAVLETRRRPNPDLEVISVKPPLSCIARRKFLLAWPIIVFHKVNCLAQSSKGAWEHESVLTCYEIDPVFTSELLVVVTRYCRQPMEEWSIERAIRFLEGTTLGGNYDELRRARLSGRPMPKLISGRLADYKWLSETLLSYPEFQHFKTEGRPWRPKNLCDWHSNIRKKLLEIQARWREHRDMELSVCRSINPLIDLITIPTHRNFIDLAYLPPEPPKNTADQ